MINLIKNELYKIFHKKGIYIVLLITLLFTLLTNIIYNSNFLEEFDMEADIEIEIYYTETLEEAGETDSEDYLSSKIYIATHKYAESFGKDSWQRYILINNLEYSTRLGEIIERITKYELKRSNDKEDYEKAIKEKDALTAELNNMNWMEFLDEEIKNTQEELKQAVEENHTFMYQAKLEALKLRKEHNIKYGFDEFNEYLEIYQSNRATVLSYEQIDENTLKQEEKTNKKEAIKETEISKYKIENHIEKVSYGSNYYIFSNFYTEFFTMILVIIVLVGGSIVSEEFSKGTIKLLLVKPYTRTKILLSKFLTVLIMILFAIISVFIMQMIIGGIFFGYDSLSIPYVTYNMTTSSIESISVLRYFLLSTIAILPQLILIGTIAFALSTITTSTSLANTLTIIGVFGSDIINGIAQSFEMEWLKFFPTLNWDYNCYLFGGNSPYKGITLPFSISICLIYFVVILLITFLVFKKKNIKNV